MEVERGWWVELMEVQDASEEHGIEGIAMFPCPIKVWRKLHGRSIAREGIAGISTNYFVPCLALVETLDAIHRSTWVYVVRKEL